MAHPQPRTQLERFAERDYRAVVGAVGRITGDPSSAADAVQDAVLALLENPPQHPIDNLAAWITVVATNRSRDGRRRAMAEGRALTRIGLLPEALDAPLPFDTNLRAAIEALPLRQRQICVLHYVLDESVDAIADRLEVTSGAVKTHLFRGRRALAARLVASEAAA